MASVFAKGQCAKNQEFNGAFCADNVELRFGIDAKNPGNNAQAGKGALVQSAQWQCQRNINMLYEIGSAATYYVGNRRQGTAQFSRIVAGSDVFQKLIDDYGNICNPKPLVIDTATGACKGPANVQQPKGIKYTLEYATLTSVGGSVSAQDVVVSEQLGFMFTDLGYDAVGAQP